MNGNKEKISAATTNANATANKAAKSGLSPLDVMLEAMREAHKAGDLKAAADYAAKVAPYLHPRITTTPHRAKKGDDWMGDAMTGDDVLASLLKG
jgi:hypothetical protein